MTPELQAACEAIFQEHKSHPFSWNKDVFHGRISTGMLDLAKEVLIEKNIIYYQHPGKKLVTLLNPEVAKAGSFTEALGLVSGKPIAFMAPPKPQPPVVKINHQPKESPAPVIQINQSKSPIREPVSEPGDKETSSVKWYLRPAFVYFIWPLLGAIVFWLIAYFISAGYDELFLKKNK